MKGIVSQVMNIVCGGCGLEKKYEMVDMPTSAVIELTAWITIAKEVFNPYSGKLEKHVDNACCLACVSTVASKLDRIEVEPEGVDLAALQQQRPQ
jgi:hypothetical protein